MVSRRGFLGASVGVVSSVVGSARAGTFKDAWGSFAELDAKPGFVSWQSLRQVTQKPLRKPAFSADVAALNGQAVKLEGYMMALDDAPQQQEFVLSAFESHCIYCVPGGMPSLAFVSAASPIQTVAGKPLALQGTLHLVKDDPSGLLYELRNARVI
jgi:uncharacterized protein